MTDPHIAALLARRREALGHPTALFYEEPLNIVRGEGVWLYDHTGRRYLDGYNNVPQVGHCHPHVVDALCRQAHTLNVHTRYLHDNVVRYAERLTATFDASLSKALFVCTGSEANELALRIARQRTGARGVLVSDCNYHGNTASIAELATGITTGCGFAPHARAVHVPDRLTELRPGETDADLLARALTEVDAAIASLQAAGHGVAAALMDPLFANEGLPQVPAGYLEGVAARVRAAGGLFIADEVQAGFGRRGDHLWGHQAWDLVPDLVTLGKPMGNGHPIGGVITRTELANGFLAGDMFFNTFAGNPVSAAVGMAVLDVLEHEQLPANALAVGGWLLQRLRELQQRHPIIAAVRGQGLFFGLDLVCQDGTPAKADTRRLVNDMKRRGVLISAIGRHDNVLKIRPPLAFRQEHAEQLWVTLDEALSAL